MQDSIMEILQFVLRFFFCVYGPFYLWIISSSRLKSFKTVSDKMKFWFRKLWSNYHSNEIFKQFCALVTTNFWFNQPIFLLIYQQNSFFVVLRWNHDKLLLNSSSITREYTRTSSNISFLIDQMAFNKVDCA